MFFFYKIIFRTLLLYEGSHDTLEGRIVLRKEAVSTVIFVVQTMLINETY
jgi:hypothetical protein